MALLFAAIFQMCARPLLTVSAPGASWDWPQDGGDPGAREAAGPQEGPPAWGISQGELSHEHCGITYGDLGFSGADVDSPT